MLDFHDSTFILQFYDEKQTRKPMTIYHLLRGKRTTSVMHLAEQYGLLPYFNTLSNLSKERYLETIRQLIEEGALLDEESELRLSAQGLMLKDASAFQLSSYPAVNGWKYGHNWQDFYQKFAFIVQISSELSYNETHYLPIERDIGRQQWVKKWLGQQKRTSLPTQLYTEMNQFFQTLSEEVAAIFVFGLTGHQLYGKTTEQLAQKWHKKTFEIAWIQLAVNHALLSELATNAQTYPLLSTLFPQEGTVTKIINKSAQKTQALLLQGSTVEEVMYHRDLKKSTILDHIVEIVMLDNDFDITPFVSREKQEKIRQRIQQAPNLKIKALQELLPEMSFFEIRLVQIRNGEVQDGKR